MKITRWKPKEEPKNKASALRLAAQVSMVKDSEERRIQNLSKLKTEHSEKIAKLQAKLTVIEDELKNTSSSAATNYIEQLKLKHSLTDAEILEVKSEILRKSIENLQLQKDMLVKDKLSISET